MGGSSTTVQKNDPWGPAQPFILEGLQSASQMWNANPNQFVIQPWTGSSVATEDPALQAARDAMGGFQYQGRPAPQIPYIPPPPPVAGGGGGSGGGTSGFWQPGQPNPKTFQTDFRTGGQFEPPATQEARSAWAFRNLMERMTALPGTTAGGASSTGGTTPTGGTSPNVQPTGGVWPGVQTSTQQTAGPTAQAAPQRSGDNLVSRQIGLANQAQQGVNYIGNLAASNQFDPRFNQGINLGMNQTNDPRFNQGVNVAMNQSNDPRFNHGVNVALNQSNDPRFNQGVNLAMNQSNDARFNRAINNMTGDGYDQRLRNQLRENVSASVMPGLNATFANSGMTGSGLHQQNLAKGLSAGMANAEAEFLNRAQDRQFQAGLAGQSALEAARQRALSAGSVSQSALEAARQRALSAGTASQGALEAARQRALSAGTASQGALEAARQRALTAGGMAQDAGMNNREQALRAFGMNNQMQQGAYNPYLQQQAVGEARTRDRQQQIAADILAYNQAQAGPVDAINNYLSLTSGLGRDFGSSASTSRNNPGLFGILGGLGQMLPFF